jgi:hypothetical protein
MDDEVGVVQHGMIDVLAKMPINLREGVIG